MCEATIYTCRSVSSRCPGFNEICTVWPSIMTFTLQFFQGLTFKIGNVKRMSPASKAGLFKMDYLISVILDPSYCQWKWLNHSCHLLIDKNSKLSLDKWTTSVQHDPRRDGQRNQKLRGHPTVGVRKVKTWTWHENNSFPENPMSLSKCYPVTTQIDSTIEQTANLKLLHNLTLAWPDHDVMVWSHWPEFNTSKLCIKEWFLLVFSFLWSLKWCSCQV